MRYQVNTLETCAQGFERLRYHSEFILLAYPGKESTPKEVLEQFLDDVDACERPDDFDYNVIRTTLELWFEGGGERLLRAELSALDSAAEQGHINWNDESADEFDSVVFRLYVEDMESS